MNRRTFLKMAGMGSISIAAGCTSETEKIFYSLVEAPFDMVTGEPHWYASTCRECPAGCGILAKNREGRVVKIEGNPLHPVNRGKLCMRGQAALQGIYSPDRIKTPLLKENNEWRPLSFSKAEVLLKEKALQAAQKGKDNIHMMTEVAGDILLGLMRKALAQWHAHDVHIFEPFAYEPLKTANQAVFGLGRLPSYHMQHADFLLSFGADFLETWLSPVEYAGKFKEMHAVKRGGKALFFHVSPYQSLSGANADHWFSCRPGTEAMVALGLIREARAQGRGRELPEDIRFAIDQAAAPYDRGKVAHISGMVPEDYEKMLRHMLRAQSPLIIGAGAPGKNATHCHAAADMLNLVLDPRLSLFDFEHSQQVEKASTRSDIQRVFENLAASPDGVLLLNNVNPVFSLSPANGIAEVLKKDSLFVVSFSNFMDETAGLSDLVFPVQLPMETWDEYSAKGGMTCLLQPAMGPLTKAPGLGDILLRIAFDQTRPNQDSPHPTFKQYLINQLIETGTIKTERDWVKALQRGGIFESATLGDSGEDSGLVPTKGAAPAEPIRFDPESVKKAFASINEFTPELTLAAAPSIRFFDGRGANKPWLCEIPDPLTRVAWQTPVLIHPNTLKSHGLAHGEVAAIQTKWGQVEAPVYETEDVRPEVILLSIGQGHTALGPYAEGMGVNPFNLLPPHTDPLSAGPLFYANGVEIRKTNRRISLAHTDGSPFQHGRKIALTVDLKTLAMPEAHSKKTDHAGLGMWDFPLTLPIPDAYDRKRDIYSPPPNNGYRWAMVVDLDKCIGCSACAAACYAENNLGVVGPEQIIKGREMAWLSVHRYLDPRHQEKISFLPMMCQHCDNAPCESVCPVYAPHHSKEGLNNQIYNRCIGTRFCSQNCPYKVRRFNWFTWQWPAPLDLQLNPDVTVRSKGVMEKCSFCIQRIKEAHNRAKNHHREILEGEIQPACLQACPTSAFTFGNILDKNSRVRKLAEDRRSYQVMGYLNTKPAVIYLKKVVQEI